jgi:hypothetical protein
MYAEYRREAFDNSLADGMNRLVLIDTCKAGGWRVMKRVEKHAVALRL